MQRHRTALAFGGAATGLGFSADGHISWTGPGRQTSSMAGPPEAMEKEDMFFRIAGQIYRFRVSGSRLVLETEHANASLTFESLGRTIRQAARETIACGPMPATGSERGVRLAVVLPRLRFR